MLTRSSTKYNITCRNTNHKNASDSNPKDNTEGSNCISGCLISRLAVCEIQLEMPSLTTSLGAAESIVRRSDHIVNLQNHLHNLSCKQSLLLLPDQRLEYILLLHVVCPNVIAINTKMWISLLRQPQECQNISLN